MGAEAELQAIALGLLAHRGQDAERTVFERLASASQQNDRAEVKRWLRIRAILALLNTSPTLPSHGPAMSSAPRACP